MRMGNLLWPNDVVEAEMSSTRPRVGIDHRTVVPAPAPAAADGDARSTADTEPDDA